MTDLKKIRKEWDSRPMEVADPSEIEARFPKKKDMYAEPKKCVVEDCLPLSFRGEPRCKDHHIAWIKEKMAEVEEAEKDRAKKQKSKQWQEEQAQARLKSLHTKCENCGVHLRFNERFVVLKPKDKIPKKPQTLEQKYRVVCEYCRG